MVIIVCLFTITLSLFKSYSLAFFSAFFFIFSPLAIGLNHIIKPELPLTCFITLSATFAILLSENDKLTFYALAGFFAGIATAMKYNGSLALIYI